MTISDTTENAILNLIYSATTWANYAQNAASAPETNIRRRAGHTGDHRRGRRDERQGNFRADAAFCA